MVQGMQMQIVLMCQMEEVKHMMEGQMQVVRKMCLIVSRSYLTLIPLTSIRVILENEVTDKMIDITERVVYKAFGLTISSDYDLPELPVVNNGQSETDIIIMKVELSQLWSEESKPNDYFVIHKDYVLFQVPDVAIYLVKNGQEIFVSPMAGSNEDQVRLFILGTCMGVILMQRKILPLHGSAVVIDGKAFAIVGDSGAGKSTLASAFLKRGYQLLSDDVIPVALSEDDIPIVTPAYPQQKLWLESLNEFEMELENLRAIIDRETKFAVPVLDQFSTKPVALAGIFELVKTEDDDIKVSPILSLEGLHTLFNHTYRNFLVERLDMMEWHFSITTKMMDHMKLYQISRPITRFTANELVDHILTKLAIKEKVT